MNFGIEILERYSINNKVDSTTEENVKFFDAYLLKTINSSKDCVDELTKESSVTQ